MCGEIFENIAHGDIGDIGDIGDVGDVGNLIFWRYRLHMTHLFPSRKRVLPRPGGLARGDAKGFSCQDYLELAWCSGGWLKDWV